MSRRWRYQCLICGREIAALMNLRKRAPTYSSAIRHLGIDINGSDTVAAGNQSRMLIAGPTLAKYSSEGNSEIEPATASRFAVDPDAAVVLAHQVFRYGQSQSRAFPNPFRRGTDLVEFVEYGLVFLRCDP